MAGCARNGGKKIIYSGITVLPSTLRNYVVTSQRRSETTDSGVTLVTRAFETKPWIVDRESRVYFKGISMSIQLLYGWCM
jgi:hypothetical protein